jgi:hypothetical protein
METYKKEVVMNNVIDVSVFIKDLLKTSGRTQKEAAEVLGYPTQTFRNKLYKRSFTLKQFLMLADAFGWEIKIEVPVVERVAITEYKYIDKGKCEIKLL